MAKNISLYDVLPASEVESMEKTLKMVFKRLGIVADFYLNETKIYDGRLLVVAKSTTFNTTPVIYDEIMVKGEGFLNKDERDESVLNLYLSFDYKFKYFSGAENGVDIGTCHFVIFTESKRVMFAGLNLKDR